MTLRPSCVLPAALLCATCMAPAGVRPEPAGDTMPPAASGNQPDVATALTAELNRLRGDHRLPAYRPDPALVRAASEYAQELAARRRLDHYSPTPGRHTHTQRIDMAGGRWQRAAENLARVPGDPAEVPSQVIRMWLGSDGHRRNMLEASYTHTGAGVFRDPRGDWWVVQLYTLQPPR